MAAAFSVARLLEAMAARGAHPAVICVAGGTKRTVSHGEIARQATRLAAALRHSGLKAGEPVGLWGPNSPEWIIASLAVVLAGGVNVPIDDQAMDEEALAYLADSGAQRAFIATAHADPLTRADAPPRDLLRLDGPEETHAGALPHWQSVIAATAADARPAAEAAAAADRPLALFYTSGTTGAPKGFFLSERNIAANVDAIRATGVVRGADHLLLPLPLHHAYPWIVGTLASFWIGVTIVLPEGASGPQLLTALRVADVTVLVGVPRLYSALAAGIAARAAGRGRLAALTFRLLTGLSRAAAERFDINLGAVLLAPVRRQIGAKLRLLVSGGAKLDGEIIWQLRALGYEVLSGYGLAETASIFTANLPKAKRVGSEGRPIAADGQIRIADPDETGTGEIELKGASVFAGYRGNDAANAAAFTADGWFRTGDLGRLDRDGFVYVTGRAKEVIVLAGGKNVYPEDIEALYGAHPFVGEVAILEQDGRLAAIVRPDLEAIASAGSLKPADAIRVALATAGQPLPSFKRLSGFVLVADPLPRTRLGKYRRFLLPEIYQRALTGPRTAAPLSTADREWLVPSPRREIWALMQDRYADRPLSLMASPQLDLGFDSFEWMALSVELEERLGIRLSEDDIGASDTVRSLIARAEARSLGGGAVSAAPVDVEAWLRPPGPALAAFARAVHTLNALLFRTVFRMRVEGDARLPADGPFIIAPNHVSDLDPALLGAALPAALRPRVTWAAEQARLFSGTLGQLFGRAMRVHPVDERRPASALTVAAAALHRGGIEVWFPEAWRSPDGRLQRFLPGIGKLIDETGAPVVPALLLGSFAAWPRHRRWPRRVPLRVVFGAPISAETLRAAAGEVARPEAIAAALAEKTAELARCTGALDVLPAPDIDKCD